MHALSLFVRRRVAWSPARGLGLRCASGTTHFGFKDVDVGEKEQLVGSVFHRVAKSYDVSSAQARKPVEQCRNVPHPLLAQLMNDLMSGSLHRLWKDSFVQMAGPLASPSSETVLLDVAGGTGDIAFRLHESLSRGLRLPGSPPRIIVCDINPSMLAVGKSRAESKGFLGKFERQSGSFG